MFSNLEKNLNYIFKDKQLLELALTHSSYINKKSNCINNERLEFLGDKVLGLVMADYIYDNFKDYSEGELSKIYSYITSKDFLIEVAEKINIEKYLKTKNQSEKSILIDAVESLIGAIYLDSNIDSVKKIILKLWIPILQNYLDNDSYNYFNPKSCLQEWAQKHKLPIPIYVDIKKEGEEHQPIFHVKLNVEGYDDIIGVGSNKQIAQKDCAMQFINKYGVCGGNKK